MTDMDTVPRHRRLSAALGLSLSGRVSPLLYPPVAAILLAVPYLYTLWVHGGAPYPTRYDGLNWLFPLRWLVEASGDNHVVLAGGLLLALASSLLLTALSFRRANWSGGAHGLALFTLVPTVQLFAALALALLPRMAAPVTPAPAWDNGEPPPEDVALIRRQEVFGLAIGMALIVLALLLSANVIGAYGIGMFVATPLVVGCTTGYAVNYRFPRTMRRTMVLVMQAGLLGTLALLMLALEGLACIILVAPLAAVFAMIGGWAGRIAAIWLRHPGQIVSSVAVLPLLFLIDGTLPPQTPITAQRSSIIDAPRAQVWAALTSDYRVAQPPGAVGLAGLAYPIASHFIGSGVGAIRVGQFSTGEGRERVTVWAPEHMLALRGELHPPAMEEMSPYRRVHAPHVHGYFDTTDFAFTLSSVGNGQTRLTLHSRHILRIDPVPYWAPIARWAVQQNMRRVLADVEQQVEARGTVETWER